MVKRELFQRSLFKFLKKEHAEQMLEGKIRIGTLGNYRAIEKYGPQIGDLNEGVLDYFCIRAHDPKIDKEPLPDLSSIGIGFGAIEERGILSEVLINFPEPVKMRDYYIFSAAKEFNKGLFKAFDDYDCCVEIFKPNEFFSTIVKKLMPFITRASVASCQYGEKKVIYDHGLITHAALIKGKEYAHQKEVRLYCKPKETFPTPVFVSSKSIAACVRLKSKKQ